MKSILNRFLRKQKQADDSLNTLKGPYIPTPDCDDVENSGFPLVPDDDRLFYVGKTIQGNGSWIDAQLAIEDGNTRDFIVAYVFDKKGNLISSDVIDCGLRSCESEQTGKEIVPRLLKKIDAKETAEILVKPFSVSFYGHTFGLVVREKEDDDDPELGTLIDAMPGYTLMFHGPWCTCNRAS